MAGNAGYQVTGGSATVTLPPYSTFGIETTLSTKWENAWLNAFPVLALIKAGKTNWNRGNAGKNPGGSAMLLPIQIAKPTQSAQGVSIANQLTAMSPVQTAGATMAQYQIASYRNGFWVTLPEVKEINDVRSNFMDFKIQQFMDDFNDVIATDFYGSNADSDSAFLGIQQALSTSNTVGLINQSTNSAWQSNVFPSVGNFSLDILDNGIDAVSNRRGQTDLIALAYSSTNNLWGKFKGALANNERLVNQEFKAKYGFTAIAYEEANVIQDGRLTAGVIAGFDTSSWFYMGDEEPQLHHISPLPSTTGWEHMYYIVGSYGTNNPGKNWRATGAT